MHSLKVQDLFSPKNFTCFLISKPVKYNYYWDQDVKFSFLSSNTFFLFQLSFLRLCFPTTKRGLPILKAHHLMDNNSAGNSYKVKLNYLSYLTPKYLGEN